MTTPHLESRGSATVAWYRGLEHPYYEDSFRLLPREVPVVGSQDRGELYAVFDGIGGCPQGRSAAIKMADTLTRFYTEPEAFENSLNGMTKLLMAGNQEIYDWGFIPGTQQMRGGCCGSIAWIKEGQLTVFHAGDTSAIQLCGDSHRQLSRADQFDSYLVTRFFGQGKRLELSVTTTEIEPLDQILLYSDGVSKVIGFEEAIDIVSPFEDPKRRARALAHRARVQGSRDDITVLCAEVADEEE